jgi:hypothetical protein
MRVILKWKLYNLIRTIVATLLNKFDCFMIIEGGTGTGKSTLAWKIALGVSREFKRLFKLDEDVVEYYYERIGRKQLNLSPEDFIEKILKLKEKKAYRFIPEKVLIYSQDAMQNSLASWNKIIIPDELINALFNRDFYGEKQKDIIKMVNMFRDHGNLTIGCVPTFANIDTQIRGLTKIKLTVKKRGTAIVHTPNKVIYSKDKWDQATNEKIEKEWIAKKITNPNYSKLTTFRGIVKFPPLSKREEEIYQAIKNKKRDTIIKEEMGIKSEEEQNKDDPFEQFIERLINGGVKNGHVINGFAYGIGTDPKKLRNKIAKRLEEMKKPTAISSYYWDKRSRNSDEEFIAIT